MEMIQVIGTNELPLSRVGWLLPVIQKGKSCFTVGAYSIRRFSRESYDSAVEEAHVTGFVTPIDVPPQYHEYVTKDCLEEINANVLSAQTLIFKSEIQLIKELDFSLSSFSNEEFIEAKPLFYFGDYLFRVVFGANIKSFAKCFFDSYIKYICQKATNADEDLCEDCASLIEFIYDGDSATNAIAVYTYVLHKIDDVPIGNILYWADGIADEYKLPRKTLEEWLSIANPMVRRT